MKRMLNILLIISLLFGNMTPVYASEDISYAYENADDTEESEELYADSSEGMVGKAVNTPINPIVSENGFWKALSISGKQATLSEGKGGEYYMVKGKKALVGANSYTDNKKIVKVTKKGVATAKKLGTVNMVTAYGAVKVTVIKPKRLTKKLKLFVGDEGKIEFEGVPEGVPVSYESNKPDIAQVCEGTVRAVGVGKATIKATIGGKAYKTTVKVKDKEGSTLIVNAAVNKKTKMKGVKKPKKRAYIISDNNIVVRKGKLIVSSNNMNGSMVEVSDGHKLLVFGESPDLVTPSITLKTGQTKPIFINNDHTRLVWKSKNPNIATVSEYGVIIAQNPGNTVLTTKVNGKTLKVRVSVVKEIYNFNRPLAIVGTVLVLDGTNGHQDKIGYIRNDGRVVWEIGDLPWEDDDYDPSKPIPQPVNPEGETYKTPILVGMEGDLEKLVTPYPVTSKTDSFNLKNPTKEGYTFLGWTGSNGSVPEKDVKVRIKGLTRDQILALYYAPNYKPISYKITYDLKGGVTDPINPSSYTIESPSISLNEPVRTGYTFTGWTGSNGEVPQKSLSIAHGSLGDKSYTANFMANNYQISLDTAGGILAVDPVINYTVETDTFILPVPTRHGYIFNGWRENGTGTPVASKAIIRGGTGNRSFTADWIESQYTITVNLNGANESIADIVSPMPLKGSLTNITFKNPTRRGYTFTGWTGSNGTVLQKDLVFDVSTMSDDEINALVFDANWAINTYDIVYNLSGGISGVPANPTSYNVNSGIITLTAPTRTGYEFTGWTGSNGTVPEKNVSIPSASIGDRVYAANWSIITYDISYNLNGGTVAVANPATYNVNTEAFVLNNPTRTGYTFIGWTGSNGLTPEKQVALPSGVVEDKEFEANWSINSYKVTVNKDEDRHIDSVTGSGEYDYNSIINITAVAKIGYHTDGWTVDEGGVTVVDDSFTMPATDVTITAKAAANTVTITYDSNGGGTAPAPTTHIYGEASNLAGVGEMSKPGLMFAGWGETNSEKTWNKQASSETAFGYANTNAANTKTLYAIWVVPCGLYEHGTDTLLRSWDNLVENNIVIEGVESGKKTARVNNSYKSYLNGDLVISPEAEKLLTFSSCSSLYKVTILAPTTINSGCFGGCYNLTQVVLPDGQTEIPQAAFNGCSKLDTINIPDSVTTIGASAFSSTGFTSFTIPGTVQTVGNYVFSGCSKLATLTMEDGVQTVCDSLCAGVSSLTSVRLSASINSIGTNMFAGCTNLATAVIPEGSTIIGQSMFAGCSKLTTATLPDGLTTINQSAFAGCAKLTGVVIPETVTSIGNQAFTGCNAITEITIPYMENLGTSVFSECKGIVTATIAEGYTYIPDMMFAVDTALTTVNVPSTLTEVNDWVCNGCSKLANFDFSNIVKIGEQAFHGAKFTTLNIPNACEIGPKAFQYNLSLTAVTLVDGTTLAEKAFLGDTALTDATLPTDLPELPDEVFNGCTQLVHTSIPETVTYIGSKAFYKTRIQIANIPNGCTLGAEAFALNLNLTTATLPNDLEVLPTRIFYQCQSLGNVELPATLTTIEAQVFDGCMVMTEVIVPDGVTSIGDQAFSSMSNAERIIIPDSVQSLGWAAVASCPKIVSINIPEGVTTLDNTFASCEKLESVTIPGSVTSIGENTFMYCKALTSVEVNPDTTVSIGYRAFFGCTGLTGITLGEGVTSIGDECFEHTHITELIMPSTITSVGTSMFSSSRLETWDMSACTNLFIPDMSNSGLNYLKTVTFGAGTNIGVYAFSGCANLDTINFVGTIAEWNALDKGGSWNISCPATVVHCSDGDTTLSSP